MNLKSFINLVDDIESNSPSIKRYINESVYNSPEMTKHWHRLDEGFFKGYSQYLQEVALTPEQIQSIFKQASGGASGAEAPKDPSKLEKIVDKVLPSDQAANLEKSLPEPDAGPVQGFEQKAQAAVQNIQGADPATKQSLMQWVKNGIKKPETQQLILAALSAGVGGLISKAGPILSMIPGGGPVVAAVTGALIAGTVAVASAKMQGKDWKSAFKGAIKPALMGGAAAVVGNLATTAVSAATSAFSGNKDDISPEVRRADAGDETPAKGASLTVGQELPNGEGTITSMDSGAGPGGRVTITKPDGSTYTVDREMAHALTGQTGISNQANMGGPVSMGATTGVDGDTPLNPGDSKPVSSTITTSGMRIAGEPVVPGQPLSDRQMSVMQMSMNMGNSYPPDVMAQFKAQQGGGGGGSSYSVPAPAGGNAAAFDQEWAAAGGKELDAAQPGQGAGGGAGQITAKGGVTLPNPDGTYPPGVKPFTGDDQIKLNQRMQQQADWAAGNNPPPEWVKNSSTGKYEPPGGPADWANGNNPPPEWIKNNQTGKYEPPTGAEGDYSSSGKVRANLDQWRTDTGSPNAPKPPSGAAMDPAYLQGVLNGEHPRPMISPEAAKAALDWQAQNGGQAATPAKPVDPAQQAADKQAWQDYWKNKKPGTRGLEESFAKSMYVDKQATLKQWLNQEAKGLPVTGLLLKPVVMEGIMDWFRGGKKDAAPAPAGTGATLDSLNQAWKAAGSPTDSEEIAKILQSAGVAPDAIAKVYTDLKIPVPGAPTTDPAKTDTNKDGKVDAADAKPAPEPTPAPTTDTNKDGKVDAADAKAEPKIAGGETPPGTVKVNIDDLFARINKLAPADKQKIIAALQG